MSDVLIPSPYAFDSPEGRAEREAQLRGAGLAVTNLLPGLLTQFSPVGKDAQGNATLQLPGAIQAAEAATNLGPLAINYASSKLGVPTNLKPFDFATAAGERYRNAADQVNSVVPHMEGQTPEEKTIQDMAFSAGGMSVPGAGVIGAIPTRLGRFAAHMVVPTLDATGTAPIVGAAFTGGAGILAERQQDRMAREIGLDPAKERIRQYNVDHGLPPDRPLADLSQPDTSGTVAHPETGAPATVPFPINLVVGSAQAAPTSQPSQSDQSTGPQPGQGEHFETLAAFGRPDIKVIAPDFSSGGESGLSGEQAIAIGLGILGAGHVGLKYGGKLLDPLYKTLTGRGDEIYTATNVANHNAQVARADAGVGVGPNAPQSGAVRGEAPLPGAAGRVGTDISQGAFDNTIKLRTLAKETAPNQLTGERLQADIGTTMGGSSLFQRMQQQMATGVNDSTGHTLTNMKRDILQPYGDLSADKQALYDKAMYAADELNSRQMNRQTMGPTATDEQIRHNFFNTDTNTLIRWRSDGLSDAEVGPLMQRSWRLQTENMQEALAMGRLNSQQMADILRTRPHQVPTTDLEGKVQHGLAERDISRPGWEAPPGRAIDALTQHYGALFGELNKNIVLDKLVTQVERWQNAAPGRPEIVSLAKDSTGTLIHPTEGRVLSVYRNGERFTYHINNTGLYRALKSGQAQTNIYLNLTNSLRRSVQAGTTGVMATVLTQRPYAIINLLRNAMQIATDRTAGLGGVGLIDRSLQRATGGRVGYTGADPTILAGALHTAVQNSGASMARNIADMLRTPDNYFTKVLTVLKGKPWVDSASAVMEGKYLASNAARYHTKVGAGAGAYGAADRPTYNIASTMGRQPRAPLAEAVPSVYSPNGLHIPYTQVRIPGTTGLAHTYINLRSMFRDVHQEISDGANAYYFKQLEKNPNLTDAQRAFEVRNVMGDPSVVGASPTAQVLSQHIPYFNPSVQDMVRMARNLRDNPVGFVTGTIQSIGTALAAELLTAMIGGKSHLAMLGRLMDAHSLASNFNFFHNPDNPHDYTQISAPQRWRMIIPVMRELMSNALGGFAMDPDHPFYQRVLHGLADMFHNHLSVGTINAGISGLSDFVDILQAPPAFQAALAAFNHKIGAPIGAVLENLYEGKPLTTNIISETGKASNVPDKVTSNVVSNDDNTWMQNLLGRIYGTAAEAYGRSVNAWERFEVNHSVADAYDGLTADAGQSWRDKAPFGNAIWGNNIKMTQNNPMEHGVELALDKMQTAVKARDVQFSGLSRSGGVPVAPTEGKLSDDPVMLQMMGRVEGFYSTLTSNIMPHVRDLKAQIRAVEADPYINAEDKRVKVNEYAGKLNDAYAEADKVVKLANASLSSMVQGRHVDVRSIDWSRDNTQFHF